MSIFDPFNINNLDSNSINDDTEFVPLLSSEDEEIMNSEEMPEVLSILPLRNTVLFPGVVIPITVGRDKSIKLIKDAYKGNKIIGVVAQKDASIEDPTFEDLYKVGTVAYIVKMLQMPDGNTTVIIQGKRKFHLKELIQENPYIKAKVENFEESAYDKNKEFAALVASLKELAIQIIQISPNIPSEAAFAIKNIESPSFLINFISSNMNAELVDKQKMLEQLNLVVRGEMVLYPILMAPLPCRAIAAKPDKRQPDDPERDAVVAHFQPSVWLDGAVRRVGQIQALTHSLKPIHPMREAPTCTALRPRCPCTPRSAPICWATISRSTGWAMRRAGRLYIPAH